MSDELTEVSPKMEPTPENFDRLRRISADLLEHGLIQETALDSLEERLAELELEQEDLGWVKMVLETENEFSAEGRRRMIKMSRMMYLKNPLVLRAVETQANYVFGQGVSIQGRHNDIDSVIQGFLDDTKNRAELSSQQARLAKEKELNTDGGLYFVFFTDKQTGATRLRTIPVCEVEDTITDPNDSKTPWFYKRVWQAREFDFKKGKTKLVTKTAYYPAFRHNPDPASRPTEIGTEGRGKPIPIEWDAPVYHVKVGGFSDWLHGVPETYAMIDWSRQYKDFLMDWATITKAFARFAFKQKQAKGGKKSVKAAATKLEQIMTGAPREGTGKGFIPPVPTRATPPAGTLIEGENSDLQPMKTSGATTSAADGRYLRLMAAAASGFPETFYGDADVGNHATATTLNRPTELMCKNRQSLWVDIFRDILTYVILQAVKAPQGKLNKLGRVIMNAEREESVKWNKISQVDPDTQKQVNKEPNAQIDIDFPEIVEIDVPGRISAIIEAEPLIPDKKLITRWLLRAFGEDDIDEMVRAMYNDAERKQAAAAQTQSSSTPEGTKGGAASQGGGGSGTRGANPQAKAATSGGATSGANDTPAPAATEGAVFDDDAFSVEIELSEAEIESDDMLGIIAGKLMRKGVPGLKVHASGADAANPLVEHGGEFYGLLDNVRIAENGAGARLTLLDIAETKQIAPARVLPQEQADETAVSQPSSEAAEQSRKKAKKADKKGPKKGRR